jgi:hypothetical protein
MSGQEIQNETVSFQNERRTVTESLMDRADTPGALLALR